LQTLLPAPAPVDALIDAGIAAAKAGDTIKAYESLTQALSSHPRHALGWLWLSGVVASDAERYYCLEQVLAIDPRSAAALRGLAMLPHGLLPTSPLQTEVAEPDPVIESAPNPAPSLSANLLVPLVLPNLFSTLPEEPELAVFAPAAIAAAAQAPAVAGQQADVDFVVRELGASRAPEEVSRMLCERRGYAWPVAQQLVAQVRHQHRVAIARRRAPFLIALGVITLLGGLALLGFGVLRLSSITQVQSASAYIPSPYYFRNMVVALGTGSMMTLGSSIGLVQVIREMWK